VNNSTSKTVPSLSESLTAATEADLPGALEPATNALTQQILPSVEQLAPPAVDVVDSAAPLILEEVAEPAAMGVKSVVQTVGSELGAVNTPLVETTEQTLAPIVGPLPLQQIVQPVIPALQDVPLVDGLSAPFVSPPVSPQEPMLSQVPSSGFVLPSFDLLMPQASVVESGAGALDGNGTLLAANSGPGSLSFPSGATAQAPGSGRAPAPLSGFATAATPGSSSSFSGGGLGLFAAILAGFTGLAFAMYAARLLRHEASLRSLSFVPFTPPRLVLGF
jgi:hypothetical protein